VTSPIAALPSQPHAGTKATPNPVVFWDGLIAPHWRVDSIRAEGPLDERSATLKLFETSRHVSLDTHAHYAIATPLRLSDGSQRWQVHLYGSAHTSEVSIDDRGSQSLELRDGWSSVLDSPPAHVLMENENGQLESATKASIRAGGGANRSATRYLIDGALVYVPAINGTTWSLGAAIETLSVLAGLDLSVGHLPASVCDAPLPQDLDLTQPARGLLRSQLDAYGLVIRRDVQRLDHHRIQEQRVLHPKSCGRMVTVGWASSQSPRGAGLVARSKHTADGGRLWETTTRGWRIESTFNLVGGWDPAHEGAADAEYGRTTSSDFSIYANAYRHWVLNEDGFYTEAPYSRGDAYDLAGLFGQPVGLQALRFLPCLTLDDNQVSLQPIVEISVDSGTTWRVYEGDYQLSRSRAAVTLQDNTLPADFLAAAKASQANVRVTASLQSPADIETKRWTGNPFKGTQDTRAFDASNIFTFAKVDANSIFFSDIQTNLRHAEESDPANEVARWLADRIDEGGGLSNSKAKPTLELKGCWLGLRVGDRLAQAGGHDRDALGRPQSSRQAFAPVRSMTHLLNPDRAGYQTVKIELDAP